MNNRDIIDKILSRNSAAEGWDELIGHYGERLYLYIRRSVVSDDIAEPLLIATLSRAITEAEQSSSYPTLRSWLYAIALKEVRAHLRPHRVSLTKIDSADLILLLEQQSSLPRSSAEFEAQRIFLNLPLRDRELYALSHFEGLDGAEIEAIVGGKREWRERRLKVLHTTLGELDPRLPYSSLSQRDKDRIKRQAIRSAQSPSDGLLIKLLPIGVALISAAIITLFTPSLWIGSEEYERAELNKFISSLSDKELEELMIDIDLDTDFYSNY